MKKITIVITLLINGAILFNACKKDQVVEDIQEYDTQTAQDNSLAEATFNDVNNIVNEAIARGDSGLNSYRVGDGQNSLLSNCATVTVTPAVPPAHGGNITVNFHTSLCLCLDGRYRKGIINIAYTGSYRDSATVITTTFSNYFVGKDSANMFRVTGTKTVTNKGRNSNGYWNFDISVEGHLINKNNDTMDWTSARNREWITGFSSQYNWSDDQYKIRGTANGKNFEGNTFTVVITSPLLVKAGCPYITQGSFELTPTGKIARTLDYGNGTCDAAATITINGRIFPITLR